MLGYIENIIAEDCRHIAAAKDMRFTDLRELGRYSGERPGNHMEPTLNLRITTPPDSNPLARDIFFRPEVGGAAHVVQGSGLEILRIHVAQPVVILVERGIKRVRTERGTTVQAMPRQAIVLSGNQTVDFQNFVQDGTCYEARWLLFDTALLDDNYYLDRSARVERPNQNPLQAHLITRVPENLIQAFERATHALSSGENIPDSVARQRVLEVMHWLLEESIVLRSSPINSSVSIKIRALIAGCLDDSWTSDRIAGELALSEATLRRRLATEGTSLTELLVDTRMAAALTLLQATTQPVSQIALAVGYESPSRFAIRFRQRFGFAPTTVRGHERAS